MEKTEGKKSGKTKRNSEWKWMKWRWKKGMQYSISAGQYQAVHWALLSQRAFHHLFPIKTTWKCLAGLKQIRACCLGPITFATCFLGLS